jgi:sulfur carrier protein
MTILVNGENVQAENETTIDRLLLLLGLQNDKVMACAVNGSIVKKDEWQVFKLCDGQKVELLNFVGGG